MEDKERVIAALANPRYSWRTVDGVIISLERVAELG